MSDAKHTEDSPVVAARLDQIRKLLSAQTELLEIGWPKGPYTDLESALLGAFLLKQKEHGDCLSYLVMQPYFTAFHEAGHIAYGLRECRGLILKQATIARSGLTLGENGWCAQSWKKVRRKKGGERQLATLLMAGKEAALEATNQLGLNSLPVYQVRWGDDNDRERALELIDPKCQDPLHDECLKPMAAEARQWLAENWALVQRIAGELLRPRDVTPQDLLKLLAP